MTEKLSERVRRGDFAEWHGYPDYRLSPGKIADEIAALEQRLEAAEAEKQQAIDAALESAAKYLDSATRIIEDSDDDYQMGRNDALSDAAMFVRSRIGTNPLAEAQARIAELEATAERANGLARFYVSDKEADAEKALIRQAQKIHEMRGEIADLTAQLAEARKDAERYRWLKPRWYWDDERDMGPGGRYWVAISVKKGRPRLDAAIDAAIKENAE